MKNKIITVTFVILLVSVFLVNLVVPAKELSESERRKLEQLPTLNFESIFAGDAMTQFDDYTLDQFFLRDGFRAIKAFVEFKLFKKSDNNNIYVIGDSVYKLEYPLKLNRVEGMADYLNRIYEEFLQESKVYYAIIPDKNYFVAEQNGYLSLDYELMIEHLTERVRNMTYINLFDTLTAEDFYRTDTHWRQENLDRVVTWIAERMNFLTDPSKIEYVEREHYPFYGVYYGQAALNIKPDKLYYLESMWTRDAVVNNIEYKGEPDQAPGVYDENRLTGMDAYDVFLSGATALTTIENPHNVTGKELIIFRDSFGGSIAPLLLEEYSKITLVDTRYINSVLLPDYVDFHGQDVLFLYSTLVVNSSNILK